MPTSSRSAERFKYGICLNDECPLCKEKKIQQIPMRKDLVCSNPDCAKPLRECPPPKSGTDFKKIGIIAAVIAILVACGFGIWELVGGPNPEDYKISIDPKEVTLKVGERVLLTPIVEPADAKVTYKWKSNDEKTAIISSGGELTALKAGKAIITLRIEEAEKPRATCKVTITPDTTTVDPDPKPEPILIQQINVSNNALELTVGEKTKLTISATPQPNDETVGYEISDESIISYENNEIKALKAGKATITFIADKSGTSVQVEVTVKKKMSESQEPKGPKDPHRGTINLGYATYSGDIKNNKPDGAGVLTYKSQHEAGRSPVTGEKVYAEAGESVDGVWSNGYLTSGTLKKKDGNQIKIKY